MEVASNMVFYIDEITTVFSLLSAVKVTKVPLRWMLWTQVLLRSDILTRILFMTVIIFFQNNNSNLKI